jgi:hypothetical protein
MNSRIDDLVNKALSDLDRFYSNYGEYKPKSSPKLDKPEKVAHKKACFCQFPGCYKKTEPKKTFCSQHILENKFNKQEAIKSTPKIIYRPAILPDSEPPQPVPPPPKELSINIKGLSSRKIIDLVKKETGELITICVKSKKNVIRHAKIILQKKGYTLHE